MKSISVRNLNRKNIENNAYNRVLNKTTLFVNLRCMEITTSTYSIFVGAGITKDSIPVNEWKELQNKSETLSSIL
jgi:isochorismate synthase